MPENATFSPAPTVESHELDSDTVLFNRENGRIFVLNETAAFIWDALKHGLDYGDIADRVAEQAGVDRAQVVADCAALAGQWREAGLEAGYPAPDADTGHEPDLPSGMSILLGSARHHPLRAAGHEQRLFRIADLRLALSAPRDAFDLFDGVLDHLSEATIPAEAPVALGLEKRDGDWVLLLEGVPLTGCNDDAKLAPMIHATVLHLSYAVSRSRLSIHGAAVFAGDRCALLPGKPGAGKSTLTAALVASGLGYCTDDFAMLDGDPLMLRGIPLCIGLKEGSWPLLRASIPSLTTLPIRLREDGQQVRYLAPVAERIASPEERFRAAAIVFPRIVENQPCRLDPLPRSAALLRIAEGGYHLLGGLDAETFEAMLTWVRSLDCYELSYSALKEAVAAVSGLLKRDSEAT
ncbi:MAG TPA: PqqD family protein [Gammaproteobacteria bacterium]|nr:PqqD family protein [Gammaproteobacteria bacterium]